MLRNLLREEPFQEKWQDQKYMADVHCPYPWRRLSLCSQMFKYPGQIGRDRDQAVMDSLETANTS